MHLRVTKKHSRSTLYSMLFIYLLLLFTSYRAAEHVTTGKDFPRLQICPGSSKQRLLVENTDNSSLTC